MQNTHVINTEFLSNYLLFNFIFWWQTSLPERTDSVLHEIESDSMRSRCCCTYWWNFRRASCADVFVFQTFRCIFLFLKATVGSLIPILASRDTHGLCDSVLKQVKRISLFSVIIKIPTMSKLFPPLVTLAVKNGISSRGLDVDLTRVSVYNIRTLCNNYGGRIVQITS